jgi:hypothetical protein
MSDFYNKYPRQYKAIVLILGDYIYDNVNKTGSGGFRYNLSDIPMKVRSFRIDYVEPEMKENVLEQLNNPKFRSEELAISELASYSFSELTMLMHYMKINNIDKKTAQKMAKDYAQYSAKANLSNSEKIKLSIYITDFVRNYKTGISGTGDDFYALMTVMSSAFQYKELRSYFKNALEGSNFLEEYGATVRLLLDESYPEDLKKAKAEVVVDNFFGTKKDVANNLFNSIPTDVLLKHQDKINPHLRAQLVRRKMSEKGYNKIAGY